MIKISKLNILKDWTYNLFLIKKKMYAVGFRFFIIFVSFYLLLGCVLGGMSYHALRERHKYSLPELQQKTEYFKKSIFQYLRFISARLENLPETKKKQILSEKNHLEESLTLEIILLNDKVKINSLNISNPNLLDTQLLEYIQAKNAEQGIHFDSFNFINFWMRTGKLEDLLIARVSSSSFFSYLKIEGIKPLRLHDSTSALKLNEGEHTLVLYPGHDLIYESQQPNFLDYYLHTYGKLLGGAFLLVIVGSIIGTLFYSTIYNTIRFRIKNALLTEKEEKEKISGILLNIKKDLDLSRLKLLNIEEKNKCLKESVDFIGANKTEVIKRTLNKLGHFIEGVDLEINNNISLLNSLK